jgi:hypothetical protein
MGHLECRRSDGTNASARRASQLLACAACSVSGGARGSRATESPRRLAAHFAAPARTHEVMINLDMPLPQDGFEVVRHTEATGRCEAPGGYRSDSSVPRGP